MLLASGIPRLAAVVGSFRKDDWDHRGLGLVMTEALANCWTKLRTQVEQAGTEGGISEAADRFVRTAGARGASPARSSLDPLRFKLTIRTT